MVEWEVISDVLPYVSRLTVPGGWLYRVHHTSNAAKIVFVPDPVIQDDTAYDRGYEAGARDAASPDAKPWVRFKDMDELKRWYKAQLNDPDYKDRT